jgi:NADH dehydrogenase
MIVGGGPTGVEMAGVLAEIAHHGLSREFRRIDPGKARVILVEGEPRVLPPYPADLSEEARLQLMRRGVEVRLGKHVTGIDAEGVTIGAERIPARTVVWAAGVKASPLAKSLGAPLDRAGRVLVTRELTVPGHAEVFVAGDLVALEQNGRLIPGVCPSAMQEGEHAARNILHAVRGEPLRPFRYIDKGSFATIGRGDAVGVIRGGTEIRGAVGWLAWLLIHIYYLIGFRNRVAVLLQWAWAYLTFKRGARLITGRGWTSS